MRYFLEDEVKEDANIESISTAINGAELIPNGFRIVGDGIKTGNHSELIIRRIYYPLDFAHKTSNIGCTFTVTNFSKLGVNLPMLPVLRKMKDGVQVGDDAYIRGYSVTESIASGTKTYVYSNISFTLSQTDIENGYYYYIVFRLHRESAIANGYTVDIAITSLSKTSTSLREVFIPDKNLKLNYELENNQVFFRKKLNGTIKFFADDYDFIMGIINTTFDTTFHFHLFEQEGSQFTSETTEFFHGTFMATDCEVDIDNKKIEVSVSPIDQYSAIIDGLDKTFDIIKITPEMTDVNIARRPVFQLYMPSEEDITCIVGDSYWTETASTPMVEYENICVANHFQPEMEFIIFDLTANSGIPNVDVRGKYYGYLQGYPYLGVETFLYKANEDASNYTFRIRILRTNQVPTPNGLAEGYLCSIYNSNGVIIYDTENILDMFYRNINYELNVSRGIYFREIQEASYSPNVVSGLGIVKVLCSRILTNSLSVMGVSTLLRSNIGGVGDISQENLNYLRLIGIQLSIGRISTRFTTTPTAYGTNLSGLYYQKPAVQAGQDCYPIYRDSWGEDFSYWVVYNDTIFGAIDVSGTARFKQKYCYTLEGVIQSFLNQLTTGVTFAGVSEHSQFFFDTINPIATILTNPQYLITQKSNMLHGIDAKPAQKAPLTFGSLLNMIKNVFKCYWFIEDGKFRLEHIKYFNNGGTYGSLVTSGAYDLTAVKNERNKHSWAFGTNKFKWDKEALPERFEFEYMDNCSEAFIGSPIEVISNYVSKGKIESVTISDFSSDIDYIQSNASDINTDGFVLLSKSKVAESEEAPIGSVPFYPATVKGYSVNLQNGILSFPFIHNYYYRHDLPAKSIRINESIITASGILKKKEQELKFPYHELNTNQLVKTDIGYGKITKMSINLASKVIEVNLAYDTEN